MTDTSNDANDTQPDTEGEGQEPTEAPETDAQEPGEGQVDNEAEKPSEGDSDDAEESDEDEDKRLNHDDALQALGKVRKENANWRKRFRDLEAKVAESTSKEDLEAALETARTEAAAEARTLLVENVALKYGLPQDLSEVLKGDTRDELEAHAKKLAKFAVRETSSDDLSGGLDPTDDEGSFDPIARAKALRKNARTY